MTSFRFPIRITDVFERKLQKHISGHGPQAIFSSDSAGWYIQIDGLHALHVGAEEPKLDGTEYELVLQPRSRK